MIRCDTIGTVTVVKVLNPVLDAPGSVPLLEAIPAEALRTRTAVIDAGHVTTIDGDGLRALCACWRLARRRGVRLALAGLPPRARLAMRLMGFDTVVPVYADLREAFQACGVELPAAPMPQLLAS